METESSKRIKGQALALIIASVAYAAVSLYGEHVANSILDRTRGEATVPVALLESAIEVIHTTVRVFIPGAILIFLLSAYALAFRLREISQASGSPSKG